MSSSLSGGGAERYVSNVLGALDRQRFAPELCLFRREIDYPLPDDVRLEIVPKPGPLGIAPAVWRLARLIDRRRPQLVVSAFSSPSFVTGNALPLAQHRPRWLARVSSDPDESEPGRLLRHWMGRLYARADSVVANAHYLCERVAQVHAPPAGVEYLPNATDFAAIDRGAEEAAPAPPSGRLRLISVGRLEPLKRFDLLLEAGAQLLERFEFELVILGEGRERARLESRAQELGLRLVLPGFCTNPWAWLARADLFVLPSATEGLPNALVEAQGLGLAAVVSGGPATGAVEVVQDGATGRIVPQGDATALASAISELLGDAPTRHAFAARARERARAQYALEPAARVLEAQLDELCRR